MEGHPRGRRGTGWLILTLGFAAQMSGPAVSDAGQPPSSRDLPTDGASYVLLRQRDTLGVELVRWWGDTSIVGTVQPIAGEARLRGVRLQYEAQLSGADPATRIVAQLREIRWRSTGPKLDGVPDVTPDQVAETTARPGGVLTRVVTADGQVQEQFAAAGGSAIPYVAHQVGLLELIARRALAGPVEVVWVGVQDRQPDTAFARVEEPRGGYRTVVGLRLGKREWHIGLDSTNRLRGALCPELGLSIARVARLDATQRLLRVPRRAASRATPLGPFKPSGLAAR